jgi:N-sulfoglucosamine sulfohydrolase
MVGHIDIVPTLCDLLDLARPRWLQGASLLSLIEGTQQEIHDALFAEVTYHAAYEPQRAVRTQRWKYIRRWGDRSRPVLPNCDDGLSKDVLLRQGWAEQDVPFEQLYDLAFDPAERHNLVGDAQYETIHQEMRERLERWMQETDDPLLRGFVPAPAGAVVDDANALSPG